MGAEKRIPSCCCRHRLHTVDTGGYSSRIVSAFPKSSSSPFTVRSKSQLAQVRQPVITTAQCTITASCSPQCSIAAAGMAAGSGPDDAAVRYQAYSRLQAAALAMGETLPIPEIVVRPILRSAGRLSLRCVLHYGDRADMLCRLLAASRTGRAHYWKHCWGCGCSARDRLQILTLSTHGVSSRLQHVQFRFNVKDVEMGTRRPLIVQMVHAPDFDEPQCRLQGAVPASAVMPFAVRTAVILTLHLMLLLSRGGLGRLRRCHHPGVGRCERHSPAHRVPAGPHGRHSVRKAPRHASGVQVRHCLTITSARSMSLSSCELTAAWYEQPAGSAPTSP